MDKYGPRVAIVGGCLLCGIGCFIRAMATSVSHLYIGNLMVGLGGFHTTIMAYASFYSWRLFLTLLSLISKNTPRNKRTLVVGGYQIQLTLVGMLGKFVYPIWHVALESILNYSGIFSDILRDRVIMTICPTVCVIGAAFLIFDDPEKYNAKAETEDPEVGFTEGKHVEGNETKTKPDEVITEKEQTKPQNDEVKASFVFLALASVLLGIFTLLFH